MRVWVIGYWNFINFPYISLTATRESINFDPFAWRVAALHHSRPHWPYNPCSSANLLPWLLCMFRDGHFPWTLRRFPQSLQYISGGYRHLRRTTRSWQAYLQRGAGGCAYHLPPMTLRRGGVKRAYSANPLHLEIHTIDGTSQVSMGQSILCLQGQGDLRRHRVRKLVHLKPAPD